MGRGNNETGAKWDGKQWDRGIVGLGNNERGAKLDGGTMGQGHSGTGGTVGQRHSETRAQWNVENNGTGAQWDEGTLRHGCNRMSANRDDHHRAASVSDCRLNWSSSDFVCPENTDRPYQRLGLFL